MSKVVVYKNRTNIVVVDLGYDISASTITSEIREGKDVDSVLIAAWGVSFETDGTDGRLLLTLDDSITGPITQTKGYMDLKQVAGGEPFAVFDNPLPVVFKEVVTA